MNQSILLIEDDRDIVALLEANIEEIGFSLVVEHDGKSGLERALGENFALVIIDLNLPKLGGMELCKRLREQNQDVPVIMLTGRTEELNRVLGLELGADDYVTKPFSLPELFARIKALLRRSVRNASAPAALPQEVHQEGTLHFADLEINLDKREVRRDGRIVTLSVTEFSLLSILCSHPGRAFSRVELVESIWGHHIEGYESNINAHINRLRKKIGDDVTNPRFVLTIWGHGYRFANPDEL